MADIDTRTSPTIYPTSEIGYALEGYGFGSPGLYYQMSEEVPDLMWPLSTRVFGRMGREDAQVQSVFAAVRLPIEGAQWRIDKAGASDEVTEEIASDFGLPIVGTDDPEPEPRPGRFDWAEHLMAALYHLIYGHQFFEPVWRVDESGNRMKYRLRKLGIRLPQTISNILVERDGGLAGIEQYGWGGTGAGSTVRIPVGRLVAYVNERQGGDWVGKSLLRAAYKNYVIKDRLMRTGAVAVERNGMGMPVYEAGPRDDQQQIDRGAKIAQAYRAGMHSGAGLPHEAKLRLVGVEGAVPDSLPHIRYHDEQIGRSVLAHFLNLGQGQPGSWALGNTFSDFFSMSLQATAIRVRNVTQAHVIRDLVDANYGPEEPAPRLVFDDIGGKQSATAQAIQMLVAAGIIKPDAVLEQAIRQDYGLPAADPDDAPAPDPAAGDPAPPAAPPSNRRHRPVARIERDGALTLF